MESFLKKTGISSHLLKAVELLNYKQPTEVQRDCIPKILAGEEVKARAPTGTGKTAAFAIPLVELLSRDPYGVFALVLSPTRELALQIQDQFKAFGAMMELKCSCIVGGVDMMKQSIELVSLRPHVVIGTPGRLNALLQQEDIKKVFGNLKFLVLDEADFLDESQKEELSELMGKISPQKTLQFSATLENTETLGTRSEVKEHMLLVPNAVKDIYLFCLLKRFPDINVIVFTESCAEAHTLSETFNELGLSILPLHSLMPQNLREHNLKQFRSARAAVLLATDVAARGLDLPQVKLVINHNCPRSSKLYLHRVGRTGRAGRTGTALTLVTQYEASLVLHIEKKLGNSLTEYYTEDQVKQLEDEVLDSMNKFTNKQAVTFHRVKRPSLDTRRSKQLLGKGLKRLKRL